MKLTHKQTTAIDILEDQRTTELLFGGGAGGAKSVLGCYWHLRNRIRYPGSRGMIGRAKLKTLKETTLKSLWEVIKMQGLKRGEHFEYNATMGTIAYANGSETLLKDLFAYPSDPDFDELGSLELTDAFIDEANQVTAKAKNIVSSRIRYKLEQFDLIPKMLMCCNPAKNWTYKEFYKPWRDGTLPDHRAFVQSLVYDNPYISPHYIEQLKKLDKNSQERLLKGNWEYDDDPSALCDFEAINDLFTNEHVEEGLGYITADVARFGSDKTVVYVWSGMIVEEITTMDTNKVTEAADLIRDLATENSIPMSRTLVDDDGIGGGVTDILGCKPFNNGAKPVGKENYQHLKAQCTYALAEAINKGEVWIACCEDPDMRDDITEELEQLKAKNMDKDGKKQIVPKEEIKQAIGRSPDYADALMMRMFWEVGNYGKYSIQ